MLIARRLLWLVPIALFFLNPGFACNSDPEYQYGAAEMRGAVEGDWVLDITPTGGTATQVTVHLAQSPVAPTAAAPGRGLVRAAYACGSRTLVASAGACIDSTQMPLAVTFVSGEPSLSSATMSGMFEVHGLTFSAGFLNLKIGTYVISATVNSDRTVTNPILTTGTVAITRP